MQSKSQIDQMLRQKSDAKEIPGVVAIAATGKEVIYQGAFGKRDLSEDVAKNQVKLMEAGILGPPEAVPQANPEMQRLYFDVVKRAANTKAANGSKLVYQWRFTDADPWHLVLDNGSTRAEPGEAPNPTVTLETSWADFVSTSKPDASPLKLVLTRRIRPRGSIREIARMRKVFG